MHDGRILTKKKNKEKDFGSKKFFGRDFLKLADFSLKKVFSHRLKSRGFAVFRFLFSSPPLPRLFPYYSRPFFTSTFCDMTNVENL